MDHADRRAANPCQEVPTATNQCHVSPSKPPTGCDERRPAVGALSDLALIGRRRGKQHGPILFANGKIRAPPETGTSPPIQGSGGSDGVKF
jgi:hypothetical protein